MKTEKQIISAEEWTNLQWERMLWCLELFFLVSAFVWEEWKYKWDNLIYTSSETNTCSLKLVKLKEGRTAQVHLKKGQWNCDKLATKGPLYHFMQADHIINISTLLFSRTWMPEVLWLGNSDSLLSFCWHLANFHNPNHNVANFICNKRCFIYQERKFSFLSFCFTIYLFSFSFSIFSNIKLMFMFQSLRM